MKKNIPTRIDTADVVVPIAVNMDSDKQIKKPKRKYLFWLWQLMLQ